MSELTRFRVTRAPQKLIAEPINRVYIDHIPDPLPDTYSIEDFQDTLRDLLAEYTEAGYTDAGSFSEGSMIRGITILGKPAQLTSHVGELDGWLTSQGNLPTPVELSNKLHDFIRNPSQMLSRARADNAAEAQDVDPHLLRQLHDNALGYQRAEGINWWFDRRNIGFSLIRAMIYNMDPSVAMYLNRLMLVMGLVELAIDRSEYLENPNRIYWALRSRTVILPQDVLDFFINQPTRSPIVRRPGFSDLYIVRDEWVRYEAGEIAHVENVMGGESQERIHTRLSESEEFITIDQERNTLDERDSQSTDRFELHDETSRDTSLNVGLETQVDMSAQYGPMSIKGHVGANLDFSLNESQAKATAQAQEIVARAVVRVEEKVRNVRTTRSLTRFEEKNSHTINNSAEGAGHIVGIYRWVNKIKRVQIFRYPNRFLLEFQIPEPGAWLRWLFDNSNQGPTIAQNPDPLTDTGMETGVVLNPSHITEEKYLSIAARYKTLGIEPPPKQQVISTNVFEKSKDEPILEQTVQFSNDATLTVPSGYKAVSWQASTQFTSGLVQRNSQASVNTIGMANIWVAVGSGESKPALTPVVAPPNPVGLPQTPEQAVKGLVNVTSGNVGGINFGKIPVSVMSSGASGFNVNVTVVCEPLPEKIEEWRIDTYEKIAQAYYAMKRQYDEELAAREVRAGIQINGQSPIRNAEMARDEIKKSVIEMLTATDFVGRNAIARSVDARGKPIPPEIMLSEAVRIAPEIQFLEQVFEWENMSYVLYPYFWADKSQWDKLADLSSEDPDFARFLRAGSARVVLPARPGYEIPVILYTYLGILWGGDPAPGPDEDDYLSIAEEIRAQEQAPRDGEPGESWEVTLPTTLIWLDNQNSSMPVPNPHTELDEPPGRELL